MKLPLLPLLAVLACAGACGAAVSAAENVPPTTDGKTVIPPPIEATPTDANPADAPHPVRPWRPENPVAAQPGVVRPGVDSSADRGVVRPPTMGGNGTTVIPGTGTGAGTVVVPGTGNVFTPGTGTGASTVIVPPPSTTPGSRAAGDMSTGTVIGTDPTLDANAQQRKPAEGPAMKSVDGQNGTRTSETDKTGAGDQKQDQPSTSTVDQTGSLNNSQQDANDQRKGQEKDSLKSQKKDSMKDQPQGQMNDQMKDSKSDSSGSKDRNSTTPGNSKSGNQTPAKAGTDPRPSSTSTGPSTGSSR